MEDGLCTNQGYVKTREFEFREIVLQRAVAGQIEEGIRAGDKGQRPN